MGRSQTLGETGERLAEAYLRKKGYKILECNYRIRGGEIDIIALDGRTIIFAEVKTRTGKKFGEAREAVDSRKQKRIALAAQHFLSSKSDGNSFCRFDVIEVDATCPLIEIRHWENAFEYAQV